MKRTAHLPALAILALCALILPIITLSSPAVTGEGEYSSAVIPEDSRDVDYVIEPRFAVELDASYGDFDTNGDGETDFRGIALDMYLTNIDTALAYGIAGIDARICFDNTRLEPLFKTGEELNGSGLNSPKPLTNFPTYNVKIPAAGLNIDVFSVEGLCKSYSHTDGSYLNPDNPNQIFTGLESYISCNYVINIETHVAYKESKIGLLNSDNVSFRYYFKVLDESGAGGEYTFTVPDSPDTAAIGSVILKAPHYTGGTPSFSNVAGRGDSITIKLWNNEHTTAEETTSAPAETTVPDVTTAAPVETTVPDVTTPAPIVTTAAPDVTTPTPIETTVPDVTTAAPVVTTAAPDDVIVTDETTPAEPSSDAPTTTEAPDGGGSCASFTALPLLGVTMLAIALIIIRTEKKDENKAS